MAGSESLLKDFFFWNVLLFVIPMVILSLTGYFTLGMVDDRVVESFGRICSVYEKDAMEGYRSDIRDIGGYMKNVSETRLVEINQERAEKYSSSLKSIEVRAEFLGSMVEEGEGCNEEYNTSHVYPGSGLSSERMDGFACYESLLEKMDMCGDSIGAVYMVEEEGGIVSSESMAGFDDGAGYEKPWYVSPESLDGESWTEIYTDNRSGNLLTTFMKPVNISGVGKGYIGMDYVLEEEIGHPYEKEFSEFIMDGSYDVIFPSGGRRDKYETLSEACSDSGERLLTTDTAGTRYLVSYRDMGVGDWSLGMSVAEKDMMSPVAAIDDEMERRRLYVTSVSHDIRSDIVKILNRARSSMVLLTVFIGFSVIFSLYIFYGNIILPIRRIKERADSLSRGGDVEEIDVDADGEIKELAEALNRMLRTMKLIIKNMVDEETE